MGQGDSKPHWQPDGAAQECAGCKQSFTVSRRRHHCRSCGLLFCDVCTKWKAHDPQHMAPGQTDRVCQPCYDALTGTISARASPPNASQPNGTNGTAGGGGTNRDNSGSPAQTPAAPARRPIVVVTEDAGSGEAGGGGDDDAGAGADDAADGDGSAVYEAAMNRANALLVDVRACAAKAPGANDKLRMTSRNIETDLKAVGGTTHLELPADADPAPVWSPHALSSMDVSATLFAVQRELPRALIDAHVAIAQAHGIWVAADGTKATIGVAVPAEPEPAEELGSTALDT